MAGKSSYKIKYFGFDDLSESDSDDESSQAKEKKAKKADAALAALSSSVDSPHTSDSQDSQASSNTGELSFYILDGKADLVISFKKKILSWESLNDTWLMFSPFTYWCLFQQSGFSNRCFWLLWWHQSQHHWGTERTLREAKWQIQG